MKTAAALTLLLGSFGATIAGASSPTPGASIDRAVTIESVPELEAAIVQYSNELRAYNGVPPLAADPRITTIARTWSEAQAHEGDISHNPNYRQQLRVVYTIKAGVGENVASGFDTQAIADALANSPSHRQNTLDPAFDRIGVGVAKVCAPDRPDSCELYVTENFVDLPNAQKRGNDDRRTRRNPRHRNP